jgi:hypothetical protein
MKGTATLVTILILSLAVWTFFYLSGLQLGAAETTVVVGAIAVLVALGNIAVRRIRKRPQAGENAEHP